MAGSGAIPYRSSSVYFLVLNMVYESAGARWAGYTLQRMTGNDSWIFNLKLTPFLTFDLWAFTDQPHMGPEV